MTIFTLSHIIRPYLERANAKKWSICTYTAKTFEKLYFG